MAVRIIEIAPKPDLREGGDPVAAHLSIRSFKWVNEQSQNTGTSSLEVMFNWIVNEKGGAYIKLAADIIPVFGAVSPSGQKYLRCIRNQQWTNDLLSLPLISD